MEKLLMSDFTKRCSGISEFVSEDHLGNKTSFQRMVTMLRPNRICFFSDNGDRLLIEGVKYIDWHEKDSDIFFDIVFRRLDSEGYYIQRVKAYK